MILKKNDPIFVAGHKGLVGSAVIRVLKKKNYSNILTIDKKKLDLRNQSRVENFIKKIKPKAVVLCAARVGGIKMNNENKAEFIFDNMSIQNNVIHSSYINGVKNLIFLGSSCVYPRSCTQPIKEKYLLNGFLEKTNEPYAIAKIAGIKLCEAYNYQYNLNYKCLMPTNTFGENDNYNLEDSHFLPALIKKIHLAKINKLKSIKLWGNGRSKRELIYVDDLADAIVHFLNKKTNHSLINIGTGRDQTIFEYAKMLFKIIEYYPKIKYIKKNLIGTPRKLLDITLAKKYGWQAKSNLNKSLKKTYGFYLKEDF